MPSRNSPENACELANLSPNRTGSASAGLSAIRRLACRKKLHAALRFRACPAPSCNISASWLGPDSAMAGVPNRHIPALVTMAPGRSKKRAAVRRLEVITGRRQTEWTGATHVQNLDVESSERESLTRG